MLPKPVLSPNIVWMPQAICKKCNRGFYAKPSWILKGHGVYCSNKCRYLGARKGKEVPCFACGKKSYKQPKALTRSQSGKFFCTKSCQTKWRNSVYVREKHANWKGGGASYRHLMHAQNIPPICTLCQNQDVRVLAVHHVDKDRSNNRIENLSWLCHNCHHLVHHYPEVCERFMAIIV